MENYLNKLAHVNGYSEAGGSFWKELDGYLVVMLSHDSTIYVEIRSGLDNGTMPMAVGEKAAQIAELEKVSDCIINKESVILSFGNESLTTDKVDLLTLELVEALKANSIPGIDNCQFCKGSMTEHDHVYIKVNNRLMKVHNECYQKFNEDVENQKSEQKGNYITGILGAVLFGAIGTIPWIIVGIMGWFASILGMVIGISANYGYNLFKGKQGKVKAVTLVIVLVAMVIGAGFVTQLYELFKYFGQEGIEGVSLIEGLQFIIIILQEDPEFARGFATNIVMGIVFGLLGSWRIIKAGGAEAPVNNLKVELVEE